MVSHLLRLSPHPLPSPIPHRNHSSPPFSISASPPAGFSPSLSSFRAGFAIPGRSPSTADLGGGGGGGNSNCRSGGGGGGSGGSKPPDLGPLSIFLHGWKSRVSADPQFPFKVLMEEIVGVSACVLGDMASRPNFGLHELDFVFSTVVVGSIVNFVLMYLLAPTVITASSSSLPSYIFQAGDFSILHRLGTFLCKGSTFAAIGFAAGLTGTAISSGLIDLRRKIRPEFQNPSNPPPTVLNALTWSIHMGLSSNLRYQSLNGVEFLLQKSGISSAGFRLAVILLRCLNNVVGGVSFVALARLTGAQKVKEDPAAVDGVENPVG